MKLNNVYNHFNVLKEDKTQNTKVSYSMNIFINNPDAKNEKEKKQGKFRATGSGSLFIPGETATQIMSVEDVINYIVQKESKNVSGSVDGVNAQDILSQMLFAFMDPESAKYLSTKDEIQFSFDYGPSDTSCVGLMVAKPFGSPSFSRVMRLNKKALPNQFNKEALDNQILTYSSVGKTN